MKILFIKPFGIGNVLHATPAIKALKILYPDSEIHFALQQRGLSVIENWGLVNKIIVLDDAFNLSKGMELGIYDIAIIGQPGNPRLRHLIKGNPVIIGDWNYINQDVHEIDVNMQLIRSLGYAGETPKSHIDMEHFDLKSDKPLIGFHCGCYSDDHSGHKAKLWPVSHSINLLKLILADYNRNIALLGGYCEVEQNNIIESALNENTRILNFSGKLTLPQAASAISQCEIMISNDSGPMHIAAALDVPVLALFGPTSQSKNYPYCSKYRIVSLNLPCQPCISPDIMGNCPHRDCTNKLSSEYVYEQFINFYQT